MPKTLERALNAQTLPKLTESGTYADGNGLALKIDARGNKRWLWRGQVNGRAAMRGLGSYPTVSLKDARKAATELKEDAREGRLEVQGSPAPVPTFAQATAAVVKMRRPTWKNDKHAAQWRNTLATYAAPRLGDVPVDTITTAQVLAVLEPIWTDKTETATRLRQRMETVFDWCIGHGYRQDNPAGRHVLRILPSTKRLKAHHRALPYADVPGVLRMVRRSNARPLMRLCFEFLVLTASRSGEVRGADWSEIDWDDCLWTIPAERMKTGREHRVPLSDRAMEILRDAWALSGPDGCIFPGPRSGAPISDMGLTQLLRREKIDAVPHGFRSSFRNWAAEKSGASWAVCEASLAHSIGSSTEQAYMRSDLLASRRELMQAWADYICG